MPSLGLHAQVLNAQVCMLTLPYRRDDQLGVGLAKRVFAITVHLRQALSLSGGDAVS